MLESLLAVSTPSPAHISHKVQLATVQLSTVYFLMHYQPVFQAEILLPLSLL